MLRIITKGLRSQQRSVKKAQRQIRIQNSRFSTSKLRENSGAVLKATTISEDATFAVAAATFDYEEVIGIKQEYFGRTLEEFKKKYEEPIINSYLSQVVPKEHQIEAKETIDAMRQKRAEKRRQRQFKQAEKDLEEHRQKERADQLKDIMTRRIPVLSEVMSSGAFDESLKANPDILTNINVEEYGEDPKFKKTIYETFTDASRPPAAIIASPHRQWEWEVTLPKNERLKLVYKDLVARGFQPNPLPRGVVLEQTDAEKLQEAVRAFNSHDSQSAQQTEAGKSEAAAPEGAATEQTTTATAEPQQMEQSEEIVENDEFLRRFIERPEDELEKDLDAALNQNAVVTEVAGTEKKFDPLANPYDPATPILTSPKPMRIKPRIIAVPLVTNKNPFAWVTVDNPSIPSTIKKTHLFRRATLLVKVSALRMPKMVRNRLIQIVGPRYDPVLDVLKITSTDHLEFRDNKLYCLRLFKAATSEAWKADLNYIPPAEDPIYPHQQIVRELQQQKYAKDLTAEYGVEAVKTRASQYPYVIFRYNPHTVPSDEVTQQRQALLLRLLQVFGVNTNSSAEK